MTESAGLNHLGLAVRDLDQTTAFFTDVLGWSETARDDSYPRKHMMFAEPGGIRLELMWPGD